MQCRAIGRERIKIRCAFPGFYAWPSVVESFLLKFNSIINLVSVDSNHAIVAFIVMTTSARL